jgi:hypothetical protein
MMFPRLHRNLRKIGYIAFILSFLLFASGLYFYSLGPENEITQLNMMDNYTVSLTAMRNKTILFSPLQLKEFTEWI